MCIAISFKLMAPIQSPISVCIRPTHIYYHTNLNYTDTVKERNIFYSLLCSVFCFFFHILFCTRALTLIELLISIFLQFGLHRLLYILCVYVRMIWHGGVRAYVCTHTLLCVYIFISFTLTQCSINLSHLVSFALFCSISSACVCVYFTLDMILVSAKIARETKTEPSK